MRRFFLLLTLFLAQAFCCRAQTVRTWTEGIFDWTGFRVVSELEEPSRASFTLMPKKRTVTRGGVNYHYTDIIAAILPEQSQVRSDCVGEAELLRIRQEFDLLEYFARAMRAEMLFSGGDGLEGQYISRFQQARKDFRAGKDISAYVLQGEPFDITTVPYSPKNHGHGLYFGPAVDFPLGGKAKELLFPGYGLSLGYEYFFGNSLLMVDLSAANSKINDPTGLWHTAWITGTAVTCLMVSVNYGYRLVSSGPFRLSVCAGPVYETRNLMHFKSAYPLGGPGITESLCLDYRLAHSVSFGPKRPGETDTGLRLRIYSDQVWSLKEKKVTPSLNASLCLFIEERGISKP